MARTERSRGRPRKHPPKTSSGRRRGHPSVLPASTIVAIVEALAAGEAQHRIARRLAVSRRMIRDVLEGRRRLESVPIAPGVTPEVEAAVDPTVTEMARWARLALIRFVRRNPRARAVVGDV